ncbi:Rab geranylgeranyltransferase [Saxophila tyrrhenica]|uniref:Geranylgeranyl transferase type-2 subunit alpha n=1 Tax=Saxophila tyrrhenica TaxID=1690608 RepID=A0AAV9PS41_9PEZI|nr:Rab geranylgeranyltransferase [Saxophila tyrrhenica]
MSHGIPRSTTTSHDNKSEAAKAKERKQIENYKALEKDVTERIQAQDFTNPTFQLTSTLLAQNPEYYTIWNHRRLLLQHVFAQELASNNGPPSNTTSQEPAHDASTTTTTTPPSNTQKKDTTLSPAQREISLLINEDLTFLLPLLKQYPKCYWIWNHRSWLLSRTSRHLPASASLTFWQAELSLIGKMLALDSRNFHGWGYRRIVVQEIERLSSRGEEEGGGSMVEAEFEYTTKMIHTNLSNFSAWHYRGTLIPRLLSSRAASSSARQDFFDDELALITQALYTDPYDQSLWFYHQFLMSTLDASNPQAGVILDPVDDGVRRRYLEQELESVREMVEGAEDCKYVYQALLEYARRLREVGGTVGREEMRGWLRELRGLDPLREGRWMDLEGKLGL